jgi:cellulose synthase/poly-beta-1,6-N-acetylglucosamine synthase-like glycosyltransferase
MKVSVIIPSNLTPRKHSASDLESKLIRAVNSALNQDYKDIEVIVVADNCMRTWFLVKNHFNEAGDELVLKMIPKQPLFSGNVRNAGIEAATGDIICYLDADDYLGTDHVSTIVKHFTGDWVWFNDMTLQGDQFKERECSLKLGLCGTSNIAHRRDLSARWLSENRYGYDDWSFIQELQKESPDGVKIETPSYVVCHIPFKKGYDV